PLMKYSSRLATRWRKASSCLLWQTTSKTAFGACVSTPRTVRGVETLDSWRLSAKAAGADRPHRLNRPATERHHLIMQVKGGIAVARNQPDLATQGKAIRPLFDFQHGVFVVDGHAGDVGHAKHPGGATFCTGRLQAQINNGTLRGGCAHDGAQQKQAMAKFQRVAPVEPAIIVVHKCIRSRLNLGVDASGHVEHGRTGAPAGDHATVETRAGQCIQITANAPGGLLGRLAAPVVRPLMLDSTVVCLDAVKTHLWQLLDS